MHLIPVNQMTCYLTGGLVARFGDVESHSNPTNTHAFFAFLSGSVQTLPLKQIGLFNWGIVLAAGVSKTHLVPNALRHTVALVLDVTNGVLSTLNAVAAFSVPLPVSIVYAGLSGCFAYGFLMCSYKDAQELRRDFSSSST